MTITSLLSLNFMILQLRLVIAQDKFDCYANFSVKFFIEIYHKAGCVTLEIMWNSLITF